MRRGNILFRVVAQAATWTHKHKLTTFSRRWSRGWVIRGSMKSITYLLWELKCRFPHFVAFEINSPFAVLQLLISTTPSTKHFYTLEKYEFKIRKIRKLRKLKLCTSFYLYFFSVYVHTSQPKFNLPPGGCYGWNFVTTTHSSVNFNSK